MNNPMNIKVAIVDDSSLIGQNLQLLLANWGYRVVLNARNGEELFRQLAVVNAPDICITDINMPGMNGYEIMRRLQKKWPGIRIIAFSGSAEETETSKTALAAGADIFVSKSAPFSVLKTALQTISNSIKRPVQDRIQ